jgi:O-antigen/teichoic acid export membrane protein
MFLQIAVTFVMTPMIIHSLGDRMYGFWILIGTFLGYYGLLDFGLSSAVSRFLSRSVGLEDVEESNRVVNTSLIMFSLIGVLVLLLSLLAIALCGFLVHNPDEVVLFRKIVMLLGVSMAIGFPMRVFGGVLEANLRYDLTTYISILRLLAANTCIWFSLRHGYGIYALAVVSFFGSIAENILQCVFARLIMPDLMIGRRFFSKGMVRQLFGYSGKTFIAQLGDLLRFRLDSMVVAGFLSVGLVTYYSVGSRFVEYFMQIMTSAVGMMAPVFSQYEGRGDYESIRRNFLHVTKFAVILSVFIGSGIIFYGNPFIQRWMGPGFDSSYQVAVILTVAYTVALMQTPGIGLLYGISKHHFYSVANMAEGILNLVLSLILVKHYGIYGVALGTAIEMLIFKLVIQPVFICRSIGMDVSVYYVKTILWTTVKSIVPLGLFYYAISGMVKADYVSITTLACIQLIIFIPFAYCFLLGNQEKQMIKQAFYHQ